MCMIDGADERVEILTDVQRTARKEHHCYECHRPIMAGESYRYEFGMFEGPNVYKTCCHCQIAREWLLKNCGGWVYGAVQEEIVEHAREYPKLAMPLLRIGAGAKRKWRGFHGGLMPLPKMPGTIQDHH